MPRLPAGFTRIFDGKTTKGWQLNSGTVHHGTTGIATVTKDGMLPSWSQQPFGQGGLFITDKTYRNFHLYLEVKVPFRDQQRNFSPLDGGRVGLSSRTGSGRRHRSVDRREPADQPGHSRARPQHQSGRPTTSTRVEVRMEGDAPHVTTIWINGVKTGGV